MNPHKHLFAQVLFILFSWNNHVIGQINAPEFLDCQDTLIRLCVQDQGVRLPANNQIYLGENDPEASSCSVHIALQTRVKVMCGTNIQYEVLYFQDDTSAPQILQSLTSLQLDTSGEVELVFDTEASPDIEIRATGISYTQESEMHHRIQWIVTDSCGNISICERLLEVYDCKSPFSSAQNEVFNEVIPLGCLLIMFAKDFDSGGRDDCTTRQNLLRSFSPDSYMPDYPIYGCAPAFGIEVPWKIWIADGGTDTNLNGYIEWGERNLFEHDFSIVFNDIGGCCEPEIMDTIISGKVTLSNSDTGIKNVEVTLTETGHAYPTFITGEDGVYSFTVQEIGQEKTISCRRNDHPKNGVSTLDLVKIQKHLLGKDTLDSPYLLIAADVNNSQNVSAIDLIELRKLILGIYTVLPNNDSWRFVRADYTFPVPDDPWNSWPQTEIGSISFTDVLNPGNLDFYGIKIGDVNNTVNPNLHGPIVPRSLPIAALKTENKRLEAGEVVVVPIQLNEAHQLTGFQFTLEFPGFEFVAIHPAAIAPDESDFALFVDRISMSWFDEKTIYIPAGEPLFYLELRALHATELSGSLAISSDITTAEMYLENEEIVQPVLEIENLDDDPGEMQLRCSPNPWRDLTEIILDLTSDEEVFISIHTPDGNTIWASDFDLMAGSNVIPLHASEIPARGLMILEARTSKARIVQKMMVVE